MATISRHFPFFGDLFLSVPFVSAGLEVYGHLNGTPKLKKKLKGFEPFPDLIIKKKVLSFYIKKQV